MLLQFGAADSVAEADLQRQPGDTKATGICKDMVKTCIEKKMQVASAEQQAKKAAEEKELAKQALEAKIQATEEVL